MRSPFNTSQETAEAFCELLAHLADTLESGDNLRCRDQLTQNLFQNLAFTLRAEQNDIIPQLNDVLQSLMYPDYSAWKKHESKYTEQVRVTADCIPPQQSIYLNDPKLLAAQRVRRGPYCLLTSSIVVRALGVSVLVAVPLSFVALMQKISPSTPATYPAVIIFLILVGLVLGGVCCMFHTTYGYGKSLARQYQQIESDDASLIRAHNSAFLLEKFKNFIRDEPGLLAKIDDFYVRWTLSLEQEQLRSPLLNDENFKRFVKFINSFSLKNVPRPRKSATKVVVWETEESPV